MYKILLVDDEDIVLEGLARFVDWEKAGFRVVGAVTSVAHAVGVLEKETIDLVITDIQMPIQSGLELIELLDNDFPQVKSIILSSYHDFSYAQQAIRLGAIDYLTKPINFKELDKLLDKVRQILDQEQIYNASTFDKIMQQTTIMNLVNGSDYEPQKVEACLDTSIPITVLRVLYKSISNNLANNKLSHLLEERYPSCKIITLREHELLIVIESRVTSDKLYSEFVDLLEPLLATMKIAIGVSQQYSSYRDIYYAALEAGKAARYQNARNASGIMSYSSIKDIYIETDNNYQNYIQSLLQLIVTPEKDSQLISTFQFILSLIQQQEPHPLLSVQKFCTELVLEMDIPLQAYSFSETQRHRNISDVLLHIVGSRNVDEVKEYVIDYFNKILKTTSLEESNSSGELISQIENYIQLHYSEHLTLDTLSKFFYISPVYLSRLFKNKVGINFIDYLTNLRIEKAKLLFNDKNLKVYQISEMVGYNNPRYFSKVFKEMTNYTPQEYRNVNI